MRVAHKHVNIVRLLKKSFSTEVYPKPLLDPHPNVTNIGHKRGFFVYNEDNYHVEPNILFYYHDGRDSIRLTTEAMRIFLTRCIYAAKLLSNGNVTVEQVNKDWINMRHMIEEFGCITPELRYRLRMVDYFSSFEDLNKDQKQAVSDLLSKIDVDYFKDKIKNLETTLNIILKQRQQRLWPDEFERLRKLPYEIVEFDLEKRGYSMDLMVKELNKQKSLSKEEAKLEVLKSLRFNDENTVRAYINGFQHDFDNLMLYDDIFDRKKMTTQFKAALTTSEPKIKKLLTVSTKKEADDLLKQILKPFYALLTGPFQELVKRDESSRFLLDDFLKYYGAKYGTELQDLSKQDIFGIHEYFFSGKKDYPIFKVTLVIYLLMGFISYNVFTRRVEEYEKKTGLMAGRN